MNNEILSYLQRWYLSKCNGVWEHENGFDISTIDNPGWKVFLNGESGKRAIEINYDISEDDWVIIKASESEFKGYGSPEKLIFILEKLKEWLK